MQLRQMKVWKHQTNQVSKLGKLGKEIQTGKTLNLLFPAVHMNEVFYQGHAYFTLIPIYNLIQHDFLIFLAHVHVVFCWYIVGDGV